MSGLDPFQLSIKIPKALYPAAVGDPSALPVLTSQLPQPSFDTVRQNSESSDPYNRIMQGVNEGALSGRPLLASSRVKTANAYHAELSRSAIEKYGKPAKQEPEAILGQDQNLKTMTAKHERDSMK